MSVKDLLYKKIEDIDSRRGRGGTYDYVKWQYVADRMNEVFGMNWSTHVESQDLIGDDIILRVSVCARDPETGEMFCQEGYGGSTMRAGDEAGTAHKGAYSKALKDACKKWGVGLHLEGGDSKPAGGNVPSGYMGHATGTPPAIKSPQPMSPSSAVPAPSAPAQGMGTPGPAQQTQSPTPGPGTGMPPQAPAPGPAQTASAPSAPTPQMAPPTQTQSAPAPTPVPGPEVGMAPPVSAPQTPSAPAPGNNNPAPMSSSPGAPDVEASPDTPGTLNNVQEMAIKNMGAMKGANDEAALVALITNSEEIELNRPINKIKDLSYNEAVNVIKAIKTLK